MKSPSSSAQHYVNECSFGEAELERQFVLGRFDWACRDVAGEKCLLGQRGLAVPEDQEEKKEKVGERALAKMVMVAKLKCLSRTERKLHTPPPIPTRTFFSFRLLISMLYLYFFIYICLVLAPLLSSYSLAREDKASLVCFGRNWFSNLIGKPSGEGDQETKTKHGEQLISLMPAGVTLLLLRMHRTYTWVYMQGK